jgi:SAM-dependent methyltransferase
VWRGRIGALRRAFKVKNPVAEDNLTALLERLQPHARVLVIGGAAVGEGMDRLYADETDVLVSGFDIYGSEHVQLIADAHQIPFADATFDAVVAQAVLEHVLEPNVVVDEIWRVLKLNGYVYAETPFLQNVHEGAYDFTRFTESGHRWLFRDFDLIFSGPGNGPGAQLVWSLSYLAWGLSRSRTVGRAVRAVIAPLQLLDRLVPRRFQVDSATGVYFLGQKSGTSIAPADIIGFYSGAQ